MCGIAGVWGGGSNADVIAQTRAMVGELRHRGPDADGTWNDSTSTVSLGHSRLSILDLSPTAGQPMELPSGTVITFNGEIYNHVELRRQLEAKGYRFRSSSDTEVLLVGYDAWGESVLQRLVGMFSFAIWDAKKRSLFLACDRIGEKPLYYAWTKNAFAFASEIHALRNCGWINHDIDREALAKYLQVGYVPAPLTIYSGIRKLAPAHALHVSKEGVVGSRYWDPVEFALAPRLNMDETAALEELEVRLSEAVQLQVRADVPVGAFLSGGIDSTAVAAKMTEAGCATVQTFTIGFGDQRFDESPWAARVAKHLGTQHTCEMLDLKTALRLTDRLGVVHGEPFADPSSLPSLLVSQVARQYVTVSLSGDGADELFGGYPVYERLGAYSQTKRIVRPLMSAIMPLSRGLPSRFRRVAERLRDNMGNPADVSYRHYFTSSQVASMVGFSPPDTQAEHTWRQAGQLTARRRAMVSDMASYLPGDVLTKVDRTSMSVSLESRAPFLDHRLVEFALRLPDRFVRRKYLLRRLVYRRVPRELVDRPKQGFDVPIGTWLREELRDRVHDTLSPDRLSKLGMESTPYVAGLVQEHMTGTADQARRLWILYAFGLWHEQQARTSPVLAA